jgi:hypothetical protein
LVGGVNASLPIFLKLLAYSHFASTHRARVGAY